MAGRLAIPGLAIGLATTLGTLVWSVQQPMPHLPTLASEKQSEQQNQKQPQGRPLPQQPPVLAEAAPAPESETAALLAEVEELLRQADAMQAALDRLDQGRPAWPDSEALASVAAQLAPAATLPAVTALLPPPDALAALPAPTAMTPQPPQLAATLPAPPETLQAQPPPRALAAMLPPAPLVTAEAPIEATRPTAPPRMAAAVPSRAPARAAARPLPARVQPVAMGGPLQRRCRAIILRAQLGEEPSRAEHDFLQEGCR
ncbi:hypothetical protein [Teichococcus oryzae]|uniref:Uncharacterized protein n=1 Tax=Teichococcus oryzae TaxID=1608942 RepID=A0A5B2TKU0_9PROT|nr:hypothetical protein [Pseudoroseomonas oryzae]KAA2214819.1 hypothetical protein F0Q34_03790 [Pseudoroseomonas oryzae]